MKEARRDPTTVEPYKCKVDFGSWYNTGMNKEFAIALLFVGIGIVMLQDPKCRRGCRTVAEHLVSHGIDDFLASLGA